MKKGPPRCDGEVYQGWNQGYRPCGKPATHLCRDYLGKDHYRCSLHLAEINLPLVQPELTKDDDDPFGGDDDGLGS